MKFRLNERMWLKSMEALDPANLSRRKPWDKGAGTSLGLSAISSATAKSSSSRLAIDARINVTEQPVMSIWGKNPMLSGEEASACAREGIQREISLTNEDTWIKWSYISLGEEW